MLPSTDRSAALAGTLLYLGKRARQAESTTMLGFITVNESLGLIDYRQSALWLPDEGVVAVSGLPETVRDAPYTQWLGHLFVAVARSAPEQACIFDAHALRTSPADDFPARVIEDWDEWLPQHVLVLPFSHRRAGAAQPGLWLLARDDAWPENEVALATELADLYAHAWRIFDPHPSWSMRCQAALSRHKKWLLASLLLLAIPVRMTVLAPAEVAPRDAFPVRAPLEGAIDLLHVRPNQAVVEHQPLFDLDTTGLRTRLAVARKAYEAASEEYRQAAQLAVTDDEKGRAELNLRKSRMEEKADELAYSEQLLDRVQVKAPRAGVAVFADAAEWVGKAVTIGERVMLIADPAQVEIHIRLPVASALDFAVDAPITLYLTSAPQLSYRGRLTYAAYQSEAMPDGIVAYRLKADFVTDSTEQALPRLGLTGTAKLYGNWVPLAFYLFRRPLATARQWLGW